MSMRILAIVAASTAVISGAVSGQRGDVSRPPIIDMHMHAVPADYFGEPPTKMCSTGMTFPWVDPTDLKAPVSHCDGPEFESAVSEEEIIRRTVAVMEQYNIIGVVSASAAGVSSPIDRLERWQKAATARVIPAVLSNGQVPLDSIRAWAQEKKIRVIGELTFQYTGYEFSDPLPERHFALAEALDLPIGIHVGPGAPGQAYFFGAPRYRARLGNPLLLEEPLLRHPKLRLYVMHAGWPMLDEMVALLYSHPQVNVDVGYISWGLPRGEFHAYLRRLVEAGLGRRVMFGSDQMIWPETLRVAIEAIESATFLSSEQKRDILYNNAARFLRLTPAASSPTDVR
jgi:predicted TIM-barrel fold metal-dependent hydrolase